MWQALLPIFEWHNTAPWGLAISGTVWMFPFIETIHILAMAMMFGSLMMLSLRLMGLGMTKQSTPVVAKTLLPFANWGLAIMLTSGYFLFSSEAMKSFSNEGFQFKMGALALSLIFQFLVFRPMLKKDDAQRSPAVSTVVAAINMSLWLAVGAGGRAIGFV